MTTAADWPRCKAWIEAALNRVGTHDISDVEAGVEAGDYQFWAGRRCAAITEIIVCPKRTDALVWLMGGDLREFMTEVLPAMSVWAKANGCARVITYAYARSGWERLFARFDVRPGWTLFIKDTDA